MGKHPYHHAADRFRDSGSLRGFNERGDPGDQSSLCPGRYHASGEAARYRRRGFCPGKCLLCFFPKGTVHVSVVDPGVGGPRKSILIVTRDYFFLGPDNGLLSLAAQGETVKQAIELTNSKYFLSGSVQRSTAGMSLPGGSSPHSGDPARHVPVPG